MRASLGYSQERLAELADLDRTYISGIERGVRNDHYSMIAFPHQPGNAAIAGMNPLF